MSPKGSYTGRTRQRKTHWSVKFADRASYLIISIGGIGTIVAVSTVFLFLLWVVYPLFTRAKITPASNADLTQTASASIRRIGLDEDQKRGWIFHEDGALNMIRLDTGQIAQQRNMAGERKLTAFYFSNTANDVVLGYENGQIQIGTLSFDAEFIDPEKLTAEQIVELDNHSSITYETGFLSKTAEGRYLHEVLTAEMADPVTVSEGVPIRLIAHAIRSTGPIFSVLTDDNRLFLTAVSKKKNFRTGKITYTPKNYEIPYQPPQDKPQPKYLTLFGQGDSLCLIWQDGYTVRFDVRQPEKPTIAEILDLAPEEQANLTALQYMIGNGTLITGDSQGRLRGWFRARREHTNTSDGTNLIMAHEFPGGSTPVRAISASSRTRMMTAGFQDGGISLYNVTNNYKMKEIRTRENRPVLALKLAGKDDGILAVTEQGFEHWRLDPRHPETTFSSLFLPVWYEGYPEPTSVWQSSGGSDDFEPKYGMLPLVFGTLKATVYSMMFGLPLALLAAIYTSEFMNPRTRTRIKPAIEMMASLPSVVLGFLAALVFAPFVEDVIPAILAVFFATPFFLLLGAYLCQMLPQTFRLRMAPYRLYYIIALIPLVILASAYMGPVLERGLLAGDTKAWLDGRIGSAAGGWMILFTPLCATGVFVAFALWINPFIRRRAREWTRGQFALAELFKFLTGCAGALLIAFLMAWIFTWMGLDPRGGFIGTYDQRNSLIVGFVMGFAIIPIIYTLSEDALSSVPEHLRSASLGCGATPWQTAARIVIPTAMSGIFSAVMIGLGRAVGETMIVLMAAGNTPVMDWNIFNGFRTLSANIAVELPEAVKNSTHYRTLFLAALTLFALTFVLNTVAEIIRIRFRKKAFEL